MNGEILKENGQEQVLQGNLTWTHRVQNLLRTMTGRITSEDVRERAAEAGIEEPSHPSAWGSAMTAAGKLGIVRKTSERVKSKRPKSHAAEIAVWERCEETLAA